MFSPNDPNRLYATSNHVHVTTNEGQSWEVISPDLTRNDPKTIMSSGGSITQDNTGAEFYANIFAIAESTLEPGVIWTGTDDGLIHVSRDNGKTWTNVTPKDSPKLNMMNCIDINPFEKGESVVEFDIEKDPRMKTTDEEYEKQFEFLLAVRDQVSEAHQAMIDIKSIRDDITYFNKNLSGKERFAELLEMTKQLNEEMTVMENNIHMTKNQSRQDPLNFGIRINNRLAFLMADQQSGDYPPTDQAEEVRQSVSHELKDELTALDALLKERLTEINKTGKPLGVQIISDRLTRNVRP